MKIVHKGKVYNTDVEIYFDGNTETMTYRTAKGNYFSVNDNTGEFLTLTEEEVMENYLNYIGIDSFSEYNEVVEVLPRLPEYVASLVEA